MGILRAVRSFFSVLIKFVVVIVLMAAFALGSYESVTYYLTGSFKDFRETEKKETAVQQEVSEGEETEQAEVEHKDSAVSLLFYEDDVYSYFDARLMVVDKNTGVLDIILLPSASKMSVSGQLKRTLSERINISESMVSFEDIARCFPREKFDYICELIALNTGYNMTGYDVIDKDHMKELIGMAGTMQLDMQHDLTYRSEDNTLEIISSELKDYKPGQVTAYMRYLDGTSTEITNRLESNSAVLEQLLTALFEKKSALEVFEQGQTLVSAHGEADDQELKEALKKTEPAAVKVRILQGSENNGKYIIDTQKTQLQIAGMEKQAAAYGQDGSATATGTTDGTTTNEKLDMELYNAAYVAGVAAGWKEYFDKHGYNVTKVDDYKEGTLDTTEIVVTKEGMGEDLLKYFPNAKITVEDIPSGAAVVIYLGKDSIYILPTYENRKPEGLDMDEGEETESEDADGEDNEDADDEGTSEESTDFEIIED